MTREVQKVYARDLTTWQGRGWQPRRTADGAVIVHASPTGTQCWVERETRVQDSLPGFGALSSQIDWVD